MVNDLDTLPRGFSNEDERLLNEHEAAAHLGYTIRALQNWRLRGGGPLFVKVSDRSIRYRKRDLTTWIEEKLRSSTSDPGPHRTTPNPPTPAPARRTARASR
jgi:hypothetical protein